MVVMVVAAFMVAAFTVADTMVVFTAVGAVVGTMEEDITAGGQVLA